MDTLALVYLANDNPEMALRTIREVSYLEPKNPSIRYHEAMIRAASVEREDAAGILRGLLSGETEFAEKADAEALLKRLQ